MMNSANHRQITARTLRQRWSASTRDTLLLLKQFAQPLLFFAASIIGGGLLYHYLSSLLGEPLSSVAEGIYLVLTLAFFQASNPFPQHPLLQLFYFFMPVIGIGTLAQGLADFGILLFNRRARNKEWEMAVASTYSKHMILVGLGHLGFRVVQNLHQMNEPIVVIELNPAADLIGIVQGMNIPVIQEDATRQTALESAGIQRANTIILCTQNDAMNLQIAVKARSMNPDVQVVIRIFDDDFAESLQKQFGFFALSATSMAAPAFAAAAAGADITRPILIENEALSLARLNVGRASSLKGMSVGSVEDKYNVSVILVKRHNEPDIQPDNARVLAQDDSLAVLGHPQDISVLVHDSH
jgi:Trk K+ transport system NAD-binding subunit